MYSRSSINPQKRHRSKAPWIVITLSMIIVYVVTMLLWPVGNISADIIKQPPVAAQPQILDWPGYGQSALFAKDYGLIGTEGAQTPVPIASITKIVTALTVLGVKPIPDPTKSPTITFTESDIERYNRYLAQDGVVAPVTPGSSISQYDLTQIMLVASANNYAETLAVWAFGSVENYVAAANAYLKSNDLNNTMVQDPAGFSTDSKSSTSDLVAIGKLALENNIIAEIVAKPSVTVPGIGTFNTTNLLVSQGAAIGIKTGNTDESGQCLLFANRTDVDGTEITLIGAILGGNSRGQVATDAAALLESGIKGFINRTFATKNQVFARYTAPWGATAELISKDEASAVIWRGDNSKVDVTAPIINPSTAFTPSAKATLTAGKKTATAKLALNQPLAKPSTFWRLTHPLTMIFE